MKKILLRVGFIVSLLFIHFPVLAQINPWNDPNGDGNTADSCLVDGVPTLKCLEVVVNNAIFMANILILVVIFIMFLIGSFKWLTSLGDADKIGEAQNTFKWAIIGLIVYLSAFLILNTIDLLFLGGTGALFRFQIGD